MKYLIEDIVILLHTNEEAIIKDIISNKEYLVESKGILFPVFETDILSYYQYDFKRNNSTNIKNEITKIQKLEIGLFFGFMPVYKLLDNEYIVDFFKVYLINNSKDNIIYEYKQYNKKTISFELNNDLNINNNIYINNVSLNLFSENIIFELKWKVKNENNFNEFIYKPKAKDILIKIDNLLLNNEESFFIKIINLVNNKEYIIEDFYKNINFLKRKPTLNYKFNNIIKQEESKYIIDIHIEKIFNKYKNLSNYEILQIQLRYVEKYLDLALRDNLYSIIIIHGIGSGKLKNEVHSLLSKINYVKRYANSYHPLYGFGSTEVFL